MEFTDNIDNQDLRMRVIDCINSLGKNAIEQLFSSGSYFKSNLTKYPTILELIQSHPTTLEDRECKSYQNILSDRYSFIFEKTEYDSIFRLIREIKNIESAVIGSADFIYEMKLSHTVADISCLARFCIEVAVYAAYLKLNSDSIDLKFIKENIVIIGMGKFGGNELNFSSDIDLIFFCDNKINNDYDLHNQMLHFFRIFLDTLRKISSDGFVYRVDMRLRPEGASGPLFMCIDQAINYYNTRAKNWEFQAFIKADIVYGSNKLFETIKNNLEPLIFKHQSPEKVLEEIKYIKEQIELEVSKKNITTDIKLSQGGIRDVEFIIQFLQLIHGVRYTEIRGTNSINALKSLRTFNIVDKEQYDTLKNNYIFLRKVENILQFTDNLPIHELPREVNSIKKIFNGWKFKGIDSRETDQPDIFLKILFTKMSEVRAIYNELFEETLNYLQMKNRISTRFEQLNPDYLSDHFKRMDSDYFLRFSEDDIARHIMMIEKITKTNLCEIYPLKVSNNQWLLIITAFDYCYEFSKIAGLLSSYYLDIIEGESFTYSEYTEEPNKIKSFGLREKYTRQIYTESIPDNSTILKRRKIVCSTRIKLANKDFAGSLFKPDWKSFKEDLSKILNNLEENTPEKAEEFLNNKIFDIMKGINLNIHPEIYPIEISVNNTSSSKYTILHIRSKDSFAFLYTFTNVLAMRNYYIFKIEIATVGGMAEDRLFIVTKAGTKIEDAKHIEELKITVTMIKQYSSLLVKAVNPSKALHYFDELLSRVLESSDKNELPIIGQKDVLEKLAKIFGISEFIWEDMFRMNYQVLLPVLNDSSTDIRIEKEALKQI